MKNQIEIFSNAEFGEIRTLKENGKVLFCGSDCAKALGYVKPQNAISAHCRYALKRGIATKQGNLSEMYFIPEGDLYRLIVHSKLPSAEKFESWVFDEVLPDIRKHGMYAKDEIIDMLLADPDLGIKLFTEYKEGKKRERKLQEENKLLAQENEEKEKLIEEMQPKVTYHDIVLRCKEVVPTTTIAKDYGMSAVKFNKLLHELGIQFKQSGVWYLYQKYANYGYTKIQTNVYVDKSGFGHSSEHSYWTQKGRLWIYETLKENGILPEIERSGN